LTANLFGQTTETDKEITRQEQRDKRADYREFMIEKQKMYNKVQGQKQIRKMIIEKEKKRKFMKRKIRRERIKTFIIGIGIGYAIGGK
jgi:adenylate kinase